MLKVFNVASFELVMLILNCASCLSHSKLSKPENTKGFLDKRADLHNQTNAYLKYASITFISSLVRVNSWISLVEEV